MVIEGGLPGGKNLTKFQLNEGLSTLFKQLTNPIDNISNYGWKKFLYYEFTPHIGKGQNYVPNYLWHLFGGGMRTKLMEEYFIYHKYPYPKLFAWITMYTLHIFNEATQLSSFKDIKNYNMMIEKTENDPVDSLADMLFFDWVGAVIFSFDCVNEFVSKYLNMQEWSYQSQLNPATGRLLNNGQLYWLRYEVFKPISINFLTGSQISALGISVEHYKNHHISFGLGKTVKTIGKDSNNDLIAGSIVWIFGLYYSIHDTPLVVLTYEGDDTKGMELYPEEKNLYSKRLRINFYPGLFSINGIKPGFSFAYQRGTFFIGITYGDWPIGLSIGDHRPKYFYR